MPTIDRRRRRTDLFTQALRYQLLACCEDGAMRAMVVSDDDGLALAASGDQTACDEVAATMAHVGTRIDSFSGTLMRRGQHWEVAMTRVMVDGSPLMVCAIGGSPEQRARQLARGAQGTVRILRAA